MSAKDGRELYLYGNVSVLRDERGTVVGAVGTFTDLTSFILAKEKIQVLEEQARSRDSFQQMIGRSGVNAGSLSTRAFGRARRRACPADRGVGNGKGIGGSGHSCLSAARRDKPFFAINCSAIPETLIESDLFGHVIGAFTGAIRDKVGVFQAAEGGTLFLDEIGDTSPLLQLKLLRVLQESEIRRVGDEKNIKVDVRLVTATNKDLKHLLTTGAVREDFFYRIRVFEITLPALRERREDFPLLVSHFLAEGSKVYPRSINEISQDGMQQMLKYSWPGNVRELRNAIEHAFVTAEGDCLTVLDLPPEIRTTASPSPAASINEPLTPDQQAERDQII